MHPVLYWSIQTTVIIGSFVFGRLYEKVKIHNELHRAIGRKLG